MLRLFAGLLVFGFATSANAVVINHYYDKAWDYVREKLRQEREICLQGSLEDLAKIAELEAAINRPRPHMSWYDAQKQRQTLEDMRDKAKLGRKESCDASYERGLEAAQEAIGNAAWEATKRALGRTD